MGHRAFPLPATLPHDPALLHVFDMDGTLLRDASVTDLARHFRREDVGIELERMYQSGAITDVEFWETLQEICRGAQQADIDAAFLGARWRQGISRTFADITERGEAAIVISQSPEFFVRGVTRWGAAAGYGSRVEIGRPCGNEATLQPAEKVQITDAILRHLEMGRAQCIAYGDSSSDSELFAWLPHTVGVNAKASIKHLTAVDYEGDSIWEAYLLGRSLVDATVPSIRAARD